MSAADDTRDRVIRMEERTKAMADRITGLDEKVDRGFADVETTLATFTGRIKDVADKVDALSALVSQEITERKTRDRIAVMGVSLARWVAGAALMGASAVVTNADRIGKWLAWLAA